MYQFDLSGGGSVENQPLCALAIIISLELFLSLFLNCTAGDSSGLGSAAFILVTGALPVVGKGHSRRSGSQPGGWPGALRNDSRRGFRSAKESGGLELSSVP